MSPRMSPLKPLAAMSSPSPLRAIPVASRRPSAASVPVLSMTLKTEFHPGRTVLLKRSSPVGTPTPHLSLLFKSTPVRLLLPGTPAYSEQVQFEQDYEGFRVSYEGPRLERVSWDKDWANEVRLTGKVTWMDAGGESPSGQPRFSFGLSVPRPPSGKKADQGAGEQHEEHEEQRQERKIADWYKVKLYGPPAAAAAAELQKGLRVVVQGRILLQDYVDKDGLPRTSAEVSASWVGIVEQSNPVWYGIQGQYSSQGQMSDQAQHGNEGQFINSGQPSNQGLHGDTPMLPGQDTWLAGQTQSDQGSLRGGGGQSAQWGEGALGGGAPRPVGDVWVELFENPGAFWDNRGNEKFLNGPDFRHKQTKEVLWIANRDTPEWVQESLPALYEVQHEAGAGMGAGVLEGVQQQGRGGYYNADGAVQSTHVDHDGYSTTPAQPGFDSWEGGHGGAQAPCEGEGQRWRGEEGYSGAGAGRAGGATPYKTQSAQRAAELWAELFQNPGNFYDNRDTKKTAKHPDFKCKRTGEGLWIVDKKTPSWVQERLPELDGPTTTY